MNAASATRADDRGRPESGAGDVLGHPKGLWFIVFTETWERFSFYGMQALLVLYMATYLLHPGKVETVAGFAPFRAAIEGVVGPLSVQALATQIFGLYIGLIYFMPVFGGLLGDQWLGRTRAVLIGAASMALGHFLMAFEAAFLFALLALIVGSGFLKGNLAAQVGDLYAKADQRRDAAFSIYNVAINIGATVAPLICGTLGEVYGWHYGFGIAGFGMLVGIVIYLAGGKHLPPDPVVGARKERHHLQPGDGRIIGGILVMFLIAALFWATQAQVWNSYPLWIKGHVDREILGLTVPVTWFQSLDSLAVLVLMPAVLWIWRVQARRGTEPDDFGKIILGCGVYAAAFLWLTAGEFVAGGDKVLLLWPVTFHFILGFGFVYVAPIMMSLVSRTAPLAVNAMMVGAYYLSIFVGGFLSGWLGRFYEVLTPLQFWLLHAGVAASGSLLVVMLRRPLGRAMRLQGGGA
ncbi:amino acid/peptide transporter [Salinisphaera sp. PC39]|uniref:peptide MFS transporter n=1 Tax=Salinisphaera sp. PC39 TaxID=1304156 RepID=UPI00334043BD